jgi:outer membrane cobalamin receptor
MAGSMVIAAEPVRLDPVVVTGTQVAVPVSELPSAVTVIEREEIESRQITDVQQLLRTVPGLSVTQTGSRGGRDQRVSARRQFQLQPGAGGRRAGEQRRGRL